MVAIAIQKQITVKNTSTLEKKLTKFWWKNVLSFSTNVDIQEKICYLFECSE